MGKSVSYQKKDEHGPARLSFFWYDNDSGHWGPFRKAQPKYFLNNHDKTLIKILGTP